MQAKDVMTTNIVPVAPDASIFETLRLMLPWRVLQISPQPAVLPIK